MEVHGVRAREVLETIRRRQRDPRREDGRRLALVVEGGGMRGVYSLGGLWGLEALGFAQVFDEVYGSSAGAVNAAYFLAGQVAYGSSVYTQEINNRSFINPWRLHKILDVDYVFDRVVTSIKPLRVERVMAAPSRLLVALLARQTAQTFVVDARESSAPLVKLLKASSALPILYNRTVEIDGCPCLDGGYAEAIAIRAAIARGCTDILVLLTRPAAYRERPPGTVGRWLFEIVCARGNRKLRRMYAEAHRRSNAVRDLVLGRGDKRPEVRIATLCPDEGGAAVERTTQHAGRLKAAMSEMVHKTRVAFGALSG